MDSAVNNKATGREIVKLWINKRLTEVPSGTPNLLEACKYAGVDVPSLCYLKDVSAAGSCRLCLVEVEQNGRKSLQASCVYPVTPGIKVFTNTRRARNARKRMLELLLSEHQMDCLSCIRNRNCELQELAQKMGIRRLRLVGERIEHPVQDKNPFIVKDYNKCIKCRRCVAVCREIQDVGAVGARNRGFKTVIGPAFMKDLAEADCIACGQCVLACPTGALAEKEYIDQVWNAINDPEKIVVVQTAPAIQVTLGEMFGQPPGTIVTGKLVAALRRIGFDKVFSTVFAADLTIVEEAHELLARLRGEGELPLISSCSPGWVKFCEHFYPEFLDNLSTCKSPQEMLGALVKTYYAEKENIDPAKLVVVAIMPCTAKKYEASRPEMVTRGTRDVDFVLTTREIVRMINEAGIDFNNLPDEEYDLPLGISTGAGNIFAATGGVTEAAIRTAYALTEGGKMEGKIEFKELRGLKGIREAVVKMGGQQIKLGVAHGTRNARRLLERVKKGERYHFIEIMGCPGGCIGGGGQPLVRKRDKQQILRKRATALYKIDINRKWRLAHENPAVKELYRTYLGEPLGRKARELLHVHYKPAPRKARALLH